MSHRILRNILVLLAAILPISAAQSQTACNVVYTISSQWGGGFGASLNLQNTGTTAWTSWTLTWTFANGQTVSQLWNGVETQSGANVTVKSESYNGAIAAGGSYNGMGFNGTWNNTTNAVPTSFAVNGTTCGAAGTGSFSLKPSASSLSVTQGSSATDTIAVTDVSPFSSSVTLAASGLPSGVTASFGTNPATGSSVLTLAASSTATTGSSTVTITGTSGSLTASTTIALTVAAKSGTGSFTLAPSASSLSVTQGSSGTDSITVTDLSPFSGSVTLAASGLPSGVTAAFGTNPATATSLLTLTASSTATTGSSTVTVTGTSASLSASTTIALTVNAVVTAAATVTVNPSSTGIAVTNQLLGMNMAAWGDPTASFIVPALQTAGIKALRWPGGSWSDIYHWSTNTNCFSSSDGAPNANATFSNFVSSLTKPGAFDVALTANYGTDAACTGPGVPSEAASWVSTALTDGLTVSHMTVGNEEYGSWEEDLHSVKNDAATYAAATIGSTGYYDSIKAASPNTLVGVSVNPGNSPSWDPIVLANAKGFYDFVEYHYYPEAPGSESDTFITQQAAQELTTNINTIKSELASAGEPNTPIYVGEIGSVYSNPGKQSQSITQGLYAGQALGEMMNDGVSRLTWWIAFYNCNGAAGNDSSSLYGWQDFGGHNVFSDGTEDPTCPNYGTAGTLDPTARAFQLFSNVAVTGEHVLTPTVTGDTTDIRAYAATHSGGQALALFNTNENNSESVEVTLTGKTSSTGVTVVTYDKAIYDLTQSDTWNGPTTTSMGAQSLPLTLTLAPWSMNVVIIQ